MFHNSHTHIYIKRLEEKENERVWDRYKPNPLFDGEWLGTAETAIVVMAMVVLKMASIYLLGHIMPPGIFVRVVGKLYGSTFSFFC